MTLAADLAWYVAQRKRLPMRIAEIKKLAVVVRDTPWARLPASEAPRLAIAIIELLGSEDPDELLMAYESRLEDHNALLDEIESYATDDSIDVKLLVALVKRKRPAR